jgi:hypothetical protein
MLRKSREPQARARERLGPKAGRRNTPNNDALPPANWSMRLHDIPLSFEINVTHGQAHALQRGLIPAP